MLVAAAALPQICQAGFAERKYLSPSVCKALVSIGVFPPNVSPQQPCAVRVIVLVSQTISRCPGKCGPAPVTVRGGRSLQEEVPGVLRGRK